MLYRRCSIALKYTLIQVMVTILCAVICIIFLLPRQKAAVRWETKTVAPVEFRFEVPDWALDEPEYYE